MGIKQAFNQAANGIASRVAMSFAIGSVMFTGMPSLAVEQSAPTTANAPALENIAPQRHGFTIIDQRSGGDLTDKRMNENIAQLPEILKKLLRGSNSFPGSTITPSELDINHMQILISASEDPNAFYDHSFPAEQPAFEITTALLKEVNEIELAGILAHEFGHREVHGKKGVFNNQPLAPADPASFYRKIDGKNGFHMPIFNEKYYHASREFMGFHFDDGTKLLASGDERNADLASIKRLHAGGLPPEAFILAMVRLQKVWGDKTPAPIPTTPFDVVSSDGSRSPHGWPIFRVAQVMNALAGFCAIETCPESTNKLVASWQQEAQALDQQGEAWAYQGTEKWLRNLQSLSPVLQPTAPLSTATTRPKQSSKPAFKR
ncbi:MAG: M48 family metalloprotease [Alphaproteobacteria bacterium]